MRLIVNLSLFFNANVNIYISNIIAQKLKNFFKMLTLQVIPIGFEPMTYCLEGSCSIQLSYGTEIRNYEW